jgi:Rad3-related DNA helicase
VCLDRLEAERMEGSPETRWREWPRLLEVLSDPARTFNGDFELLGFQLSAELRARIGGDSDQCAWSKCPFFQRCYVRQVREQAQRAQIIVVNHTLLLLDASAEGAILPNREVIVLDEAHHLEEEATRAFTKVVAFSHITSVLAHTTVREHTPIKLQEETLHCATRLWQQLEQRMAATSAQKVLLGEQMPEALLLTDSLTALADALGGQPPLYQTEKEGILYNKLIQRIHNLAERVRIVFGVDQPKAYVYFLERVSTPGDRVSSIEASVAPLDVAPWLERKLFDKWPILCASATLATVTPDPTQPGARGSTLAYFKQHVGLRERQALERILPLTFDYRANALLYVPCDLPEPANDDDDEQATRDYVQAVVQRMHRLVTLSKGRAFLLFTSTTMLNQVYEALAQQLPYPLLRQGDHPRAELVRMFRTERNAVLFGVKTFWEGVDVPGEALSLVVIDRLPFAPPDDPVHQARVARMKALGENWFRGYVLPQMVLQLKQGVGRLLRTDEDRGVMAILDTRLLTKGYGTSVLRALPPAPLVTSIDKVAQFFVHLDHE